jgi:chromosome segregation ATPase
VSDQANIQDIQILGDLKIAFGRFGEDVVQILATLQKQFEEVQEQLEDRQEHWQRQVDAAQEEVYEARRSLRECESQGEDEDGGSPDCGFEEEQVSDAEKELAGYEENLEKVKQWRHRIEGQIADFQSDMHHLSILASSRTGSAQTFLVSKIEILNRYVGSGFSGRVGQPATVAAPSPVKGKRFSQSLKRKVRELNRQKNDGKLKSDKSGVELIQPQQHTKGITPPSNEAHVDHKHPRSKGGESTIENAQVLSRIENLKKGNKTDDYEDNKSE